jgi:excisionase family DNA binding protein
MAVLWLTLFSEAQTMSNLLTVSEVAARLRCSRWGVYAMAKDGRLPAVRLSSRRLLFDEDAVEQAVRNAQRQPTISSDRNQKSAAVAG